MIRKVSLFIAIMMMLVMSSCCKKPKTVYYNGTVLEHKIMTETSGDFLSTSSWTYILVVFRHTDGTVNTYRGWLESDTNEILSLIHSCNKKLRLGVMKDKYIKEYSCWDGLSAR